VVSGTDSLDVAVREVLENAIEHDDSPEPVVDVTVETGADEAVVVVADEGPGLPQQERQVLERGEESALTHSSGLGLWLVTWIVASVGGEIELGSPAASGTTIRLHLPLAGEPSPERPAGVGSP
jgi:signal transduction histidine kinase